MQTGTIQLVDVPDETKLQSFTAEVLANTPYRDEKLDDAGIPPDSPVRANGPIKHVIYIVKENRTYDQVLGDIKEGNGDPSLVLFGEKVDAELPQAGARVRAARQLLRELRRQRRRPQLGHRRHCARFHAAHVAEPVCRAQQDLQLRRRGAGEFASRRLHLDQRRPGRHLAARITDTSPKTGPNPPPMEARSRACAIPFCSKVTNLDYRSFDLDYPDVERAKVFLDDLGDWQKDGMMPQLLIMRMGNDHTSGTTPGKIAPLSASADNDQGVGMVVEGVSKSRYWNDTAIFIIEDDAQNGPDHVDSHRSTCYVISPWVKRHAVNSTMYNQASVLRTMEIILGMHPMTTYDAGARPMFGVFAAAPSPGTYTLEKPQIPLDRPQSRRSRPPPRARIA